MTHIGAKVRACEMLYEAVVKTVLLYRSKSWVVIGAMLKVFGIFHHWEDRWIVGMIDWSA